MKNTINYIAKLKSFLIFLIITLIACNSEQKKGNANLNSTKLSQSDDLINISEKQFKAGNMELGKMTMQKFNTVVKANGMFTIPPQNQADVSAYFAGYVKEIKLLLGKSVKKGEVLFTIENPEYIQVQQEFLEVKGKLNYLKSDYDRQKELVLDNVTSQKNYLKAESDYLVAFAQYQALKKRLSLMNINTNTLTGENIRTVINVTSPLTGYVTVINATKGMYLNPSDVAVTVANTDELHVELKIFEKDLPNVKPDQIINIRLQNQIEKVYLAKIHLINKTINPQDRTIEIHADLVNKNETKLFGPGMYIEAEILTTAAEYPALALEAIANIDNDYFVLIKESPTSFKRTLVKIGSINREYAQIINASDFKESTEFLTKGAFNLITN